MANLRIKEVIKEKGMTVKKVARRMGIIPSALSQSINGNPTVETLQKIASALDVRVVDLFEKNEDFFALVREKGTVRMFDSAHALKEFTDAMVKLDDGATAFSESLDQLKEKRQKNM